MAYKVANRETLAHLAHHPSWSALRELADEKRQKAFDRLAKDLILGEAISDTDVAYTRGFFKGMSFLLSAPGLEDAKLERALADERKEVNTVV